jgi:hypothetical protein
VATPRYIGPLLGIAYSKRLNCLGNFRIMIHKESTLAVQHSIIFRHVVSTVFPRERERERKEEEERDKKNAHFDTSSGFRRQSCSAPRFRFCPRPFRKHRAGPRPMAPATSSSSSSTAKRLIRFSGSLRRTEAPRRPTPPPSPPPKKLKPMAEVMAKARHAVVERVDYSDVSCQQCGSGDRADELLLCDKCDKGFHMKCLRPIVVRVPIGSWLCPKCSGRRRVRSRDFFVFVFVVSHSFVFLECEI